MNSKHTLKLLAILAMLLLVLSACSGAADIQEQILGKWKITNEALEITMVLNFLEDGFVIVTIADLEVTGTYEWLEGDVIKITMTKDGYSEEILGPVQIEGDQLMITNDRGEVEVFTRVQ